MAQIVLNLLKMEVVKITITHVPYLTVRELREKLGLSQAEVARRAGVSPPTVYRLEDPDWPYGINAEAAEWIADVLGVPVDAIAWHRPLTNTGRRAGSGKPCKKSLPTKPEATCPSCHYTLPATGNCGNCE